MKPIICHMTSAHPADDIRIFQKQCTSLAQLGYEVHLVAAGTLGSENKEVIHHRLPEAGKQSRLRRMLFRAWRTWRLASQTGAQLFHFHDPELLPYGLLLKLRGKTVVYDAHEDLPRDILTKTWIPAYLRTPLSQLAEWIENFIARRLDKVVAATPFICQRFLKAGSNAIDIKNFPLVNKCNQEFIVTDKTPQLPAICYAGLISIPRGIVEIIQASARLPVRLILAGSFIDKQTEEMVRSLPEWEQVDYRGPVSREEIARIYAESQAGLCLFHPLSAHIDSLPNKLFEYMSAGLPVIASNFSSWIPYVTQNQCGFCVDPLNVDAIIESIKWILNHPEERIVMGQRGVAAVETRYTWEAEAKSLDQTYQQILGG